MSTNNSHSGFVTLGASNHCNFFYVDEDFKYHPIEHIHIDGNKLIVTTKDIDDDIEYETSEELDSFLKQFKING